MQSLWKRGLCFLSPSFSVSQVVYIELHPSRKCRFEMVEQQVKRCLDWRQHPPPVRTPGAFRFEDDTVADIIGNDSRHRTTPVNPGVIRIYSSGGRLPVENLVFSRPRAAVFVETLVTAFVVEKDFIKRGDSVSGTVYMIDAPHGVFSHGTRGVPESERRVLVKQVHYRISTHSEPEGERELLHSNHIALRSHSESVDNTASRVGGLEPAAAT